LIYDNVFAVPEGTWVVSYRLICDNVEVQDMFKRKCKDSTKYIIWDCPHEETHGYLLHSESLDTLVDLIDMDGITEEMVFHAELSGDWHEIFTTLNLE